MSWVEFDVRLTGDGRLIVFHDETLGRTTGAQGRVRETSAEAIRALDAGSWFGRSFAGERVPLLEEALAALAALGLGANIEMKCDRGLAVATAQGVARVLAQNWPRDSLPPLVSSFDVMALDALKAAAPHWPRGLLLQRLKGDWRATFARLACSTLHIGIRGLTRTGIEAARSVGVPVVVYTVNDPEQARTLFDWGVDSIITDVPDAISAVA